MSLSLHPLSLSMNLSISENDMVRLSFRPVFPGKVGGERRKEGVIAWLPLKDLADQVLDRFMLTDQSCKNYL